MPPKESKDHRPEAARKARKATIPKPKAANVETADLVLTEGMPDHHSRPSKMNAMKVDIDTYEIKPFIKKLADKLEFGPAVKLPRATASKLIKFWEHASRRTSKIHDGWGGGRSAPKFGKRLVEWTPANGTKMVLLGGHNYDFLVLHKDKTYGISKPDRRQRRLVATYRASSPRPPPTLAERVLPALKALPAQAASFVRKFWKNVDVGGGHSRARAQLRSAVFRAAAALSETPPAMRRFARADWRGFAGKKLTAKLTRAQDALANAMQAASASHRLAIANGEDEAPITEALGVATEAAKAVIEDVQRAAVANAAKQPWGKVISGAVFERLGAYQRDDKDDKYLHGRKVALYFTASWCPPCRRFTPKLVSLYEGMRAPLPEVEVVLVSWDETRRDRQEYVDDTKMRWLALPHESGELADTMTLRYDVQHVPTLVVLQVSKDGKDASVLSREGRDDVEDIFPGSPQWLR
jgi:thiol-disulfide isomerase/thioredoxin